MLFVPFTVCGKQLDDNEKNEIKLWCYIRYITYVRSLCGGPCLSYTDK